MICYNLTFTVTILIVPGNLEMLRTAGAAILRQIPILSTAAPSRQSQWQNCQEWMQAEFLSLSAQLKQLCLVKENRFFFFLPISSSDASVSAFLC